MLYFMDNDDADLESRLQSPSIFKKLKRLVYGAALYCSLGCSYDSQVSSYIQQQRDERMSPISWVQPHSDQERFEKERRDTLKFLPFTVLETFPKNGNEGLYAWTFKNKDGKIHVRQDLVDYQDERNLRSQVHEPRHRFDEYETREITEETLRPLFPIREKYKTKRGDYKR